MEDKWLFLDDSGQLSNSGTHNYFLYGGIFIENEKAYNLFMNIVKQQCQFFGINGEIKGSDIKIKHRKKLLQAFSEVPGIHQVFLVEDVRQLERVDFENKKKIRFHKNYLLKRIVEKLHKEKLINAKTILHINIDLEMLSEERYRNNLEKHLNDYWKNKSSYLKGIEYSQFIPKIGSQFVVKFLDSRHHRFIQVADLLVNTKYRRYKNTTKCCSEFLNPEICIKVPDFFTSGKEKID
ncbi:DUF3800 domain-containing protein [Streptococcus phocae]|uniref:DUF3800 domain-containing protein n=1 Tax=Streptococcus phocae TaxID=119224 RepID=A0A0P6S307_9STRE|nr:DUF3800 domain-containing protein [Streptococcus phocae]KPJ22970.1 hypothetical protein AKK44_01580 [Streptococcus phocae]